jgi:hypothetical protein
MAYIGNPVQQALTKVTSQSFNGTGSQTVFTLNRAVNTGEELEVFVENVQQEPGVGKSYTATGTTLTFDAAPQSGTGNIYVIYRGIAEVTRRLEHDPNQALAATTGTFNGDLTVDTNTLYVDSTSNNVGIGNSNPQHKLHITHSATGAIPTDYQIGATNPNDNYQGIHNSNNSATFSGLSLETRTSGASRWLIANEWKGTYLGDLVFRNRNAGVTSQESMRIDSSGRVTMPYQPAFFASGGSGAFNASGIFVGDSNAAQKTNVGGHYSYSTGRFTAPIAGVYMFSYLLTINDTSAHMVNIHINGADNLQPVLHYYNQYESATNVVIFTLAANDYVEAHLRASSGYGYYGARFCGHLIG